MASSRLFDWRRNQITLILQVNVKRFYEACGQSNSAPFQWHQPGALHLTGLILALFAFCGVGRLAAQQPEFLIEPIPNWTSSIEAKDRNNPLEKQATAGVFFLLFDVEINGATHERFVHVAQKFISTVGVEANSRLSFNFDPSYQQLVIHKIVIHRGGQILDQLAPERIRLIQQEKELDRLIYNGAKTALLFLEDVRVGDWLEFAYTVRGRNPVEAGHFYDALQLRFSFPIQTENYRLLWPTNNQPLWVQRAGSAPKTGTVKGEFYEYAWRWENREGQEMESFAPASVIQYASAHFTDYKSWAEVANWAEKSFHPEKLTEALYQKIIRIRDESTSDEQRVLKALQFVQDDIRYLGIENGINSHQPTDPSIVFTRGYGDCKDKALLLCTILRFFDRVDAVPVLVSTRFRGGTKGFIPTPLFLDHAIVRIVVNGRTNFVDVTRSFQRGSLDQRFIDYFGAGVLLDENAPELITIPATTAGMPETRIEESFDVSTNGATTLAVTSTFRGRDADFMREALASVSQDSMEKNLLAFYKKYYENIVAIGEPRKYDDERLNTIQLIRRYFIPNIWKPALQTNFISCEFITHGIFDRLYVPAKRERKWPLAVSFPENFIHTMRIQPHEPWRVIPKERKIRSNALLFQNRTTCTNNQIEVTCQILTLNQGVPAAEMPRYWADLDEIGHFLGLSITKPVAGLRLNDTPNWTIWIAGISYSAVLLIGAVLLYRYQPRSPPPLPLSSDPSLQGLGGWLILLGIALAVTPFVRVNALVSTGAVYSNSNWRVITDPSGAGYDSSLAPILLYELFFQLTLLVFSILLVALFFQKKRIFKIVLIGYLSFQFVVFTLDHILAETRKTKPVTIGTQSSAVPRAGQTLVPLVLWGLYVLRSKRVKMTFLN